MAKQTEYAIVIEPLSEQDGGGWLATIPALPGCIGDGETQAEAVADVLMAMVECKHAAKQAGREVTSLVSLG